MPCWSPTTSKHRAKGNIDRNTYRTEVQIEILDHG